jgi:general secretion pathway protein D
MMQIFTRPVVLVLMLSLSLGVISVEAATKKISQLEFRDISVSDALRILSEQSGLNVVASKAAAKVKMTMYLRDIEPMAVLEAIAKTYNLWYQKDPASGVVRIYTVDEFRLGKVDYKNEQTKIYTFKHERNALDFAYIIQDLYGFDRVRLSPGADESEIIDDLSDRLERYNLIAKNTMNLGGGSSSDFGVSAGSSSGSSNQGNRSGGSQGNRSGNNRQNSRFGGNNRSGSSTQTIDTNDIVDSSKLLPKSEVEGLFAGGYDNSAQSMSRLIERLSPIYVTRIKRQNRVLVRTRDRKVIREINRLYKQINTELATVLMEVKLLQIDLSDGYDSLFDFQIKSNKTTITKGQSATSALNQSLEAAAATFNPALLATYVSDKFQARLQLLEKEGRVTEVATPILLTANQEVSRVFIGDERPIVNGYKESTASTPNNGNSNIINQTIIVPQTEVRNLGTTLLLTPNINQDKSVSLRILIEQSTLSPTKATIPVQVAGSLIDANIDVVQTKTFSGTIIARHGAAIAVGGLIEDKASDVENKVPVLGDIPGLGFFFREEAKLRKRTELVVIIRPYITTNPIETAKFSQQYIRDHSLHPIAHDIDEMGIYSNRGKQHKSYRLEKPFKEYNLQDQFEEKSRKSQRINLNSGHSNNSAVNKQKTYLELTEFAARAIRQSPEKRKPHPQIKAVSLKGIAPLDLLYDARIKTIPVASWRKGGVHVTAIAVYNLSDSPLTVDYKHLKGRWLASTIEKSRLKSLGAMGDSTYLYLISAGPYRDIVHQIKRSMP